VVLIGALLCAGCARQMAEEEPSPAHATRTVSVVVAAPLPRLPHDQAVTAIPKVEVADNRITVGDQTVDVAPLRADSAVSTLGGVYFLNAGELWFLAKHGARSTGFTGLKGVVVSASGRYLGLVDRNHGPASHGGAALAAAVVYDTGTGKVKLRSYAGMGDPSAGLTKTYAAQPPAVRDFEGRALVVDTPSGTWRYPLDGSDPTRVS